MTKKSPFIPKILLVDDDPAMRRILAKWIALGGYDVSCANDGHQATAAIQADCPHLLITDWDMPHMDGVELCRWVRTSDLPHYVYTLLLTTRTGSADTVDGLEAGADDFLKKPVDRSELMARMHAGIRVLELESRLSLLAKMDPLTGLPNQRTFYEYVATEWARSSRHHFPISCVMVDIDFFKRVNDTHGHLTGDEVIRHVGQTLAASCRSSDIVSRYGGEEFCVLLPETDEANAAVWADRIRARIGESEIDCDGKPLKITVSLGVAQKAGDVHTPEELVDLADQALLVAKRSGRDRVVPFHSIRSTTIDSSSGGPGALLDGLTAGDVMTSVVAGLKMNETVGSAAQYFLRFRINSAPVVDDEGRLVGILSEKDVMSIMLWPNWWTMKIKDVMKRNVVCYDENTPVMTIYEFLCRVSIRGVVIGRDEAPTGLISRGSLLRWVTNSLAAGSSALPRRLADEFHAAADAGALDPHERIAMTAHVLVEETEKLASGLSGRSSDLIPVVVGGATRVQELVNDLLSLSRHLNQHPTETGELSDWFQS